MAQKVVGFIKLQIPAGKATLVELELDQVEVVAD